MIQQQLHLFTLRFGDLDKNIEIFLPDRKNNSEIFKFKYLMHYILYLNIY